MNYDGWELPYAGKGVSVSALFDEEYGLSPGEMLHCLG